MTRICKSRMRVIRFHTDSWSSVRGSDEGTEVSVGCTEDWRHNAVMTMEKWCALTCFTFSLVAAQKLGHNY